MAATAASVSRTASIFESSQGGGHCAARRSSSTSSGGSPASMASSAGMKGPLSAPKTRCSSRMNPAVTDSVAAFTNAVEPSASSAMAWNPTV